MPKQEASAPDKQNGLLTSVAVEATVTRRTLMMLRRLCIAALMLAPLMATAQGYPTKPIKFIVP